MTTRDKLIDYAGAVSQTQSATWRIAPQIQIQAGMILWRGFPNGLAGISAEGVSNGICCDLMNVAGIQGISAQLAKQQPRLSIESFVVA